MFCPQCKAEYRPHVLRCSDCNVPLVKHLSATHSDADHERVPGVAVLKGLGPIIAIPFVGAALVILSVALRKNPFGIQIVSLLAYTGFVFLLVFCDTGRWKGYSLSERAVRQKLPLLVYIHAGFLAVMFAGVTGATLLRSHLSDFWTVERGTRRPLSYFDLILCLTGVTILYSQVFIFRGILGRAPKDEQKNSGS
jgi:hypothetical protein